jgi:DNA-binding beta-propeller fold protein YncE
MCVICCRMTRIKRLVPIAIFVFALACVCSGQAAKPMLAVLNQAEASLLLIDPVTMKLVSRIPTGNGPHEVAFSADGRTAFVSNYGDQTPGSTLSVIDVASAKESRRVDLSPLFRPHGLRFLGGKLYFTAETNRMIARFDPAAGKVDWMMGTGQNVSHMIAVSADQKKMVTSNLGSDSVTMFDFAATPPAGSKLTNIPVGKQPEAIDLSPDGREIWVGLNADGVTEVLDTATGKSVARIEMKGQPYRIKFTPDGKQVICTVPPTKELVFINAATRKETGRMKFDGTPLGITFSADGKTAFLTLNDPDSIVKVDLEKMEVTGRAESGKRPDGIAVFGQ